MFLIGSMLYYALEIFIIINMIRNTIIVAKNIPNIIHYSLFFCVSFCCHRLLYAVTALANDYLAISFKFLKLCSILISCLNHYQVNQNAL